MKKIIIITIIIIVLIIIGAGAVFLFADGTSQTTGILGSLLSGSEVSKKFLTIEQKQNADECATIDCLYENFIEECTPSYGDLFFEEQQVVIYLEVAGKENGKCLTNIRLIDANGTAAYAKGLEANCWLTQEELDALQKNFNINDMNCKGPLYEAAKLTN
jgi:hypothetical protein